MEPILIGLRKIYKNLDFIPVLSSLQTNNKKFLNLFSQIVFGIPDLTATPTLRDQAIECTTPTLMEEGDEQGFSTFSQAVIQTKKSEKVCIPATILTMTVIRKLLVRVDQSLQKLLKNICFPEETQIRISHFQLCGLLEYALPASINADSNDIFYKSQTDPEWEKLKNYCTVYVFYCFCLQD